MTNFSSIVEILKVSVTAITVVRFSLQMYICCKGLLATSFVLNCIALTFSLNLYKLDSLFSLFRNLIDK